MATISHHSTPYILRLRVPRLGGNSEYIWSLDGCQHKIFPCFDFWVNIQQKTHVCGEFLGKQHLSVHLLVRFVCLCNTLSAIFSFILYPVQAIRGFVFIVLSSPKFMFRDFAKVESRNLGWKSGLCNNFTFVTLAQTRAELKATPELVQRGGRRS